jgi:Putative amidoligase enzyme
MAQNLLSSWQELKTLNSGYMADKTWLKNWFSSQVKHNLQKHTKWYRFNHLNSSSITSLKEEYKRIGECIGDFKRLDYDPSYVADWFNEPEQHEFRRRGTPLAILGAVFGDDGYIQCNDCDKIEHENDSRYCYNDYYVCSDCSDDYVWSDSHDSYVSPDDADDDYDDDDEPEYENIGSYHSSKRVLGHIPSSYDQRKPRVLLGVELEMEAKRDSIDDLDERAEHLLDHMAWADGADGRRYRYCALEQDGSLDYGFEMVSGYTGLDIHRKQLEFFKDRFEGMRSHDTSTCGLHIHICKSDMSIYHAMKMVLFINDTGNSRLVRTLARRDASSYAKFKDKKGDKSWYKDASRARANKADKLRCLNADRYEALNFQNEKTIEFRLFRGTLKYETIMACLEFTYATWFFCRDTSAYDLTSEKFIEFIQKPEQKQDTKFLRAYLTEKGFIQAKVKNDLAVEAV